MINIGEFSFSILLTQVILQVIFLGILITELFNHKRKNKFDVTWLLLIMIFWISFLAVSEYGMFTNGISSLWSWIAISFLIIGLVLFTIMVTTRLRFFNKFLVIPDIAVAFAVLIGALIDRHNFAPETILPMVISVFLVTALGTFVFIDYLIKTSSGYRTKTRVESRGWLMPWKAWTVVVASSFVFLFTFLSFAGNIMLAPTDQVELSGKLNIYNLGETTLENPEELKIVVNEKYFEDGIEATEKLKKTYDKYSRVFISDSSRENQQVKDGIAEELLNE